jgi:hypothetical protein
MLRGLWRAASAPAATMRAFTATERLFAALAEDRLQPFDEPGALGLLLEPLTHGSALDAALTRLRATLPPAAPPVTRRAEPIPPERTGGPDDPLEAPATPVSRPMTTPDRMPAPGEPSQRLALSLAQPGPIVSARSADPLTAAAAHRVVGAAPLPEATRRVIARLLDDARSAPLHTLLAAVGVPEAATAPAQAPGDDPPAAPLDRVLAKVAASRQAARPVGTATADDVAPRALPAAPSTGLRRLAHRFAAGQGAAAVRATREAAPAGVRATAPVHGSTALALPFTSQRRMIPSEDDELAERLAAILRRDARRQGLLDEGGTG